MYFFGSNYVGARAIHRVDAGSTVCGWRRLDLDFRILKNSWIFTFDFNPIVGIFSLENAPLTYNLLSSSLHHSSKYNNNHANQLCGIRSIQMQCFSFEWSTVGTSSGLLNKNRNKIEVGFIQSNKCVICLFVKTTRISWYVVAMKRDCKEEPSDRRHHQSNGWKWKWRKKTSKKRKHDLRCEWIEHTAMESVWCECCVGRRPNIVRHSVAPMIKMNR